MKIIITNESGDFKEMLYTKDKITYEVKNQEIMNFFLNWQRHLLMRTIWMKCTNVFIIS